MATARPAAPVRIPPSRRAHQPVTFTEVQVTKDVHRYNSVKQVVANRRAQTLVAACLATNCFWAADSLRTSLDYIQRELLGMKVVLVNTNVLLVSQTAKTNKYCQRASNKGWLSVALAAGAAGLGYVLVAR